MSYNEPDSATFVTFHDNVSLERGVYDRVDLSTGRILETNFLVIEADDIFVRGKSLTKQYLSMGPDGDRKYLFSVVCNGKICVLHAPDTTSRLSVGRAKNNACEGINEDDESGRLQKTIFYKVSKVDPATTRRLYFFCDTADTSIYPPLADPWVLEASMEPPDMSRLMSNKGSMEEKIIHICQNVKETAQRNPEYNDLSALDTAIYLARRYYFVSDTVVKYKIFMTFYFFNQDMYWIAFSDMIKMQEKKGATSVRKDKKIPAVSANPVQKNSYPRLIYNSSKQLLSSAPFHHDTLQIQNPDGSWVTDLEGRTLLTYACQQNQSPERVKMLVKMGLPANLKDRHGKSPRQYCTENKNKKLLKLLPR